MKHTDLFRRRLLQKQQELNTICQTTAEAAAIVELDQSRVGRLSRVDALQRQAISQEGQRRNLQQLREIEAALARIENGQFGECLECGEDIAQKRLEFNPAVPLCIACATKKEAP